MDRLPLHLSSIQQGRVSNHLAFGRALRRFLLSKEPLSLLPNCGWMDGGCLILRAALVQWGGGALRPGASIRLQGAIPYVDHGFAWIDLEGRRVILDGDGVQDEVGLRQKLIQLEGVYPSGVRYSKARELVVGIPVSPWASGRLCLLLSRRFGAFRRELLTQGAEAPLKALCDPPGRHVCEPAYDASWRPGC